MSTIEWTDETWNPTLGCDRVSPGCDGCYAITSSRIRSGNPHPAIAAAHAGLTEHLGGRLDWTGTVRELPARLDTPLHWRKPRRVFVDSMSDLFHDDVSDEFIGSVFEVMAKTPQHTYQVLTKRHGRMRSLLRRWATEGEKHDWAGPGTAVFRRHDLCWVGPIRWPLPNVWLGVSVEDQKRADLRIPALLDTPAAVRFLSCEPLLGPVDLWGPIHPLKGRSKLTYWTTGRPGFAAEGTPLGDSGLTTHDLTVGPKLDWVIAGGESGPGARPAHPDWFRLLRDQCANDGVAFFFKQWGDWTPRKSGPHVVRFVDGAPDPRRHRFVRPDGTHAGHDEFAGPPRDDNVAFVHRPGKKAAGRELDGRTHDEFPQAVTP